MNDMNSRRLIPEHEIMVSIIVLRCHNINGRLSFALFTNVVWIVLLGSLPRLLSMRLAPKRG